MARKNIFQLVEESYDIFSEIDKINELFYSEIYFCNNTEGDLTFSYLVKNYLFNDWKYKGTCLSMDEFFTRANAVVYRNGRSKLSEDVVINNLEIMENFIKLYFDNEENLYNEYTFEYYSELNSEFIFLINTLEKRMGLTTREYKDRVIVYPKNAPLEKVVDLCDDEDVQWELIRYVREDLSLSERRKSLAYLATNLYIEEDDSEKEEPIKSIVKNACILLNNLHIRHNNKTGKWENQALKDLDKNDAISLCDMVYNEMLTIVLLREHKEYEKTYAEFRKKQKEVKCKKKTDAKDADI